MSELIDRERFSADMRDFQNRVGIWRDEAEDTETWTRADAALATIIETKLILDKQPTIAAPRWVRCEEPPENACDCLVCWTTIHDEETGEVTGHGFWCEKGWYETGGVLEDGFYCQNRVEIHPVRVEPDYWMPIEPPKEDA